MPRRMKQAGLIVNTDRTSLSAARGLYALMETVLLFAPRGFSKLCLTANRHKVTAVVCPHSPRLP